MYTSQFKQELSTGELRALTSRNHERFVSRMCEPNTCGRRDGMLSVGDNVPKETVCSAGGKVKH